jgi:hypothetical protein
VLAGHWHWAEVLGHWLVSDACPRLVADTGALGSQGSGWPTRGGIPGRLLMVLCFGPVVVDVLAQVMMKDGAASDTFGDTQSPVIRTEEQLSTQLASKGGSP